MSRKGKYPDISTNSPWASRPAGWANKTNYQCEGDPTGYGPVCIYNNVYVSVCIYIYIYIHYNRV